MRDDIKAMIAKSLKKMRQDHGLTQGELAKICNVDASTIVRYEKNNVTMQIDTIIKIVAAFNIDIFIFFENIIAKTHEKNYANNN